MESCRDPRGNIWKLIHSDLRALLKEAGRLHGHYCPYLALGVKAGAKAIRELGIEHEGMEDVLAIVETNSCFSDGIQYATGCTFGNNSLVYKDYGKTAVTLAKRGGEGIRLVLKPHQGDIWAKKYPQYDELFEVVVKERRGDDEQREELMNLSRKISFQLITADLEKVFTIKRVEVELPNYAPIYESFICSKCGESVMTSRMVERGKDKLCIPCAGKDFYRLDGSGINHKSKED